MSVAKTDPALSDPAPLDTASAVIQGIATACRDLDGGLMEALVRINRRFGYVPPESQAIVADVLNVSQADVAGVIGFYTDFRKSAPGRVIVQMCRAEACQAAGGEAVAAAVQAALGCAFGNTRADGAVTLEAAYCFGNCALAPAAMIDGRLIGRVEVDALQASISATIAKAAAG